MKLKYIMILIALSSLLFSTTTTISDRIGQNKTTAPVAKEFLIYEEINGVMQLVNEPYDSLGISTSKISDDDGDAYVDVESTTDSDSVKIAAPSGIYIMNNNVYISQMNAAGTSFIQIGKINASNAFEFGTGVWFNANIYNADSGMVPMFQMATNGTGTNGLYIRLGDKIPFKVFGDGQGDGTTEEIQTVFLGIQIYEGEDVTCSGDAGTASVWYNSTYVTTESAGSADVLALADGIKGQEKYIELITDGGDDLEVTPTNFANGTKITLDTAGESVTLRFDGTNWVIKSHYGGVVA